MIKKLLSKILTKLFGYKYYHITVEWYKDGNKSGVTAFYYFIPRLQRIDISEIRQEINEDIAIINVVRCEKYKE
jgi:hypothetical protein